MAAAKEVDSLCATVAKTLAEGRIGRPVFVRMSAQVTGVQELAEMVDALVATTSAWFDGPPAESNGGAHAGHTVHLLRWASGGSAILSVSQETGRRAPAFDLMILGSKGAIYYRTV